MQRDAPSDVVQGAKMAFKIRRVQYFNATVRDQPGEAYKLLTLLADLGINLVGFTAIPVGPTQTHLTMFPEDGAKMADAAKKSGLVLDGPNRALLVQGEDQLGALAAIHEKLYQAKVNVYASMAVASAADSYGYVIYVRPEEYERAATALEV
jgi:hypothetical protein